MPVFLRAFRYFTNEFISWYVVNIFITPSEKCVDEIIFSFFFFPERCRKLPKGLKDWQAFLDLKKRIDDFSESCPLLEMMTNKAMKQRHWDRISELTGTPFDVESDSFCLRNIMEAPLLKNKDDIEVHKIIRSYLSPKF